MSINNHDKIKEQLDSVGCGFCLAKWTQVTMHLGLGMTHSCHHPAPHKVGLSEIARNPSALHNTRFKKQVRKEMLEGKRPAECNYCWNIEDSSLSFSDRVFKSSETWSAPYFDEIVNSDYRQDFNPKYVEVSFSNTCNFKCMYCGPQFSSKWVEEVEQHGPYPTSTNFNGIDHLKERDEMPILLTEYNPYTAAFWEWWPDLYKDLHTFRITGGEPLLSKDTFKVLEHIQENWQENPNLSLAINTNMGVPDKLMTRFLELCKDLTENSKVRELIIFTSIEAMGKQAEYARFGLNTEKFWFNVDNALTLLPKVTVNVMATFNALSVYSYNHLIDKIFLLKKKHQNDQRYWVSAIQLDSSYLRWPPHLSVQILEDKHKELILDAAKRALYYGIKEYTHDNYGFSNIEIQKIKRIYDFAMKKLPPAELIQRRQDFSKFITEYDNRRGTHFATTFPELVGLWNDYK